MTKRVQMIMDRRSAVWFCNRQEHNYPCIYPSHYLYNPLSSCFDPSSLKLPEGIGLSWSLHMLLLIYLIPAHSSPLTICAIYVYLLLGNFKRNFFGKKRKSIYLKISDWEPREVVWQVMRKSKLVEWLIQVIMKRYSFSRTRMYSECQR